MPRCLLRSSSLTRSADNRCARLACCQCAAAPSPVWAYRVGHLVSSGPICARTPAPARVNWKFGTTADARRSPVSFAYRDNAPYRAAGSGGSIVLERGLVHSQPFQDIVEAVTVRAGG